MISIPTNNIAKAIRRCYTYEQFEHLKNMLDECKYETIGCNKLIKDLLPIAEKKVLIKEAKTFSLYKIGKTFFTHTRLLEDHEIIIVTKLKKMGYKFQYEIQF